MMMDMMMEMVLDFGVTLNFTGLFFDFTGLFFDFTGLSFLLKLVFKILELELTFKVLDLE